MRRNWIHLEQLIGVLVRDSAGRAVGRIEEVHAEQSDGQALITEFILGTQGLLQRLSISDASMFFLGWFWRSSFGEQNRSSGSLAADGFIAACAAETALYARSAK